MGLTFEQLGLEAGSVAAEVDMRAVGEDERVRFVKGVAAWEGWKLGGEPAPFQRANIPPSLGGHPALALPRVSGAVGLMCPASSVHSKISR